MLPHRFEPSLDDDGTRLLAGYSDGASQEEHDDDYTDTDTSDSEVDSEDDHPETAYLASSHSLGKMVPHPQSTLVSLYDTIRHHTIVIESRDRDLKQEHLFHFNVSFRSTSQQATQTERIKRKTLMVQNEQRKALGNDSSYATHISSEQQTRIDNEDHSNCFDTVARACTILQNFEHIHTLQCQHLVMPAYPHMQRVVNSGLTTDALIGMPIDVEAVSVPHTVAATGDQMRCCAWSCLPHYHSPTHVQYKAVNVTHEYTTPTFSLESLRLKLHMPGSTLLSVPFDTDRSPDVHHVEGLRILAGGKVLELTLTDTPTNDSNPLLAGHVVSMRDLRWVREGVFTTDQQALRHFVCCSIVHVQLTVLEDVTSTVVTLDLTKSGLHTKASDVDGISVGPDQLQSSDTLLMNESMQYRLYFDVGCKVRQLVQRTAVDAI